ncbi:MAG: type II toxin-antitoxin system RelE/ParE family toxin [Leadbetterella sp.]|nr:type II toxin-antitoxin system RelE/ParE family toxin [Leadbetterella sp.]
MEVVWSKSSINELQKIYKHIAKDSALNAERVINTLVDLTMELADNPAKYPLDKFKTGNNGSWRAFEKYNYRISYRVASDQIRIVRLRHTKRSPLKY